MSGPRRHPVAFRERFEAHPSVNASPVDAQMPRDLTDLQAGNRRRISPQFVDVSLHPRPSARDRSKARRLIVLDPLLPTTRGHPQTMNQNNSFLVGTHKGSLNPGILIVRYLEAHGASRLDEDSRECSNRLFAVPVALQLASQLDPADRLRSCLLYTTERGFVSLP
jgi:hypothetical protein